MYVHQHDAVLDYYGRRLATCSSDKTIKIFEIDGDKHHLQETLKGYKNCNRCKNYRAYIHPDMRALFGVWRGYAKPPIPRIVIVLHQLYQKYVHFAEAKHELIFFPGTPKIRDLTSFLLLRWPSPHLARITSTISTTTAPVVPCLHIHSSHCFCQHGFMVAT